MASGERSEGTVAYMARALDLAERGRTTVSPNPLVGCVIVNDGQIVGEGWHERAGEAHAEVRALQAAGERARGATVYVTLEPCAHTGRTGPCTAALIEAGVATVVIALEDPNPVASGGAEHLRAAGIAVHTGMLEDRAREQNRVFLHVLRHGRPFVTLKAATSLDGRIAAADGTSQWLTGPAARVRVHQLRAEVDAVAVGSGTVLADDPRLTVRLADAGSGSPATQPLRVILDGRGRTPPGARAIDGSAPSLIVTTETGARRLPGTMDHLVVPPGPGGGVDLAATLRGLLARGVHSLLVEGGARVASAFQTAGLVDRFELHLAPVILGHEGRPLFFHGPTTLADAERFTLRDLERHGNDVVLSLVSAGTSNEPAATVPETAGEEQH